MLLLLKSNAALHIYSHIWLVAGAHCSEDFDGCQVGPCTAGTNCTDLTPEQEAAQGTAFNCTPCPQGYEKSDGVCVGMCHLMLFIVQWSLIHFMYLLREPKFIQLLLLGSS